MNSNKEMATRAQQLAKRSDGLQRRAAMCASVALGTTGSVAAARNALTVLWQPDLKEAALDLIGQLATANHEETG